MKDGGNKETRFLSIINNHKGLAFKVASVYTSTKEDREDLIQEMHFQLWKSFDSFQGKSKVTTWMYKVYLNTSILFLKQNSHKITLEDLTEVSSSSAENDTARSESVSNLMELIHNLNELDKGIILLYLEEKSHKDIAEITGLSPSNVGTRIQRIKKKLVNLKNK